MQNDVLRNTIVPWQEKGRWYHAHLTELGVDVNNTDQFILDHVTINPGSAYAVVDKGYSVCDYILRFNNFSRTSNSSYNKQFGLQADGKFSLSITGLGNYTTVDADLYIFIV